MATTKKSASRPSKTTRKKRAASKGLIVKKTVASSKPSTVPTPAIETGPVRHHPFRRRSKPDLPAIFHPKLPSAPALTRIAVLLLWKRKGLFTGIMLTYGVLSILLVQGLASTAEVTSLKQAMLQLFHGHISGLGKGVGAMLVIVASAGSDSQIASAYQSFLLILVSLAMIYSLRQAVAGAQLRIRDAYYRSTYPLVPFLLVLLMIGIQLVPLATGAYIYNLVVVSGIAGNVLEQAFWVLFLLATAGWSLYMISSSFIALYIASLPDMTPFKALRSARQLVRGRRLLVLRKVLFMLLVLLVVAIIIMAPVVIGLTALASLIFFVLSLIGIAWLHAYMYSLYRELLNE